MKLFDDIEKINNNKLINYKKIFDKFFISSNKSAIPLIVISATTKNNLFYYYLRSLENIYYLNNKKIKLIFKDINANDIIFQITEDEIKKMISNFCSNKLNFNCILENENSIYSVEINIFPYNLIKKKIIF